MGIKQATTSQESVMLYVEVTSSAFLETYAFATDSRKHAGEYIAFLIAAGMIPRVLLTVNFTWETSVPTREDMRDKQGL